jgi:hypothetical protein
MNMEWMDVSGDKCLLMPPPFVVVAAGVLLSAVYSSSLFSLASDALVLLSANFVD